MKKLIVFLAFLSLGLFAVLESQTVNATIGTSSGTPVATCSFRVLGLDVTSSSLWMCNANVWFRPWAAPGPPSAGDQVAISSASGTAAWKQVASGADCGATDTTHALNYTHSTNTIGCVAIAGGGGTTWPFAFSAPPLTGWSWLNQNVNGSTNTVSTANGEIYLSTNGAGDGIAGYVRTKIAATFTITAAITLGYGNASDASHYSETGIMVTDGTARIAYGVLAYNNLGLLLTAFKWTTATASSGAVTNFTANAGAGNLLPWSAPVLWLRIQETVANRTYSISPDGNNWVQIVSTTNTDFLTTSQYGMFIRGAGGFNAGGAMYSFTETNP